MKILFLDDDPLRHVKFMQSQGSKDITYVWSAKAAIEALTKEVFDEATLDHDLGGTASQMELPAAGEESGYDVALFIASMPVDRRPKLVIVHSFNPAGARRMCDALEKAANEGMKLYKIPFNY